MNKKIFIVFFIILTVCLFYFCFLNKKLNFNQAQNVIVKEKLNYNNACITTRSEKIVNGNSMAPLFESGQSLLLLENYYQCNEVKRGDVVAYDHSSRKNPLIKRVKVVGGDNLEFVDNKLLINGQILINSQAEIYAFTPQQKQWLSLYIEEGRLRKDAYLIFGENINSSLDSRKFGAVGKNGFLGKFDFGK